MIDRKTGSGAQVQPEPLYDCFNRVMMTYMMRWPLTFFVLFCPLFLQGETRAADLSPPEEESVVFGRLVLDWGPGGITETEDQRHPMVLAVLNESSGARFEVASDQNGSNARFFARLPAGRYRITKWSKGESEFSLPALFEVRKGEAAYIGSIQWVRLVSPLRPPPGRSGFQRGRLLIGDEYEEEAARFKERHPEIQKPVVKSIIKFAQ